MLYRWQMDDMDHKYMKKHNKHHKHYDWGEANKRYSKSRQSVFETVEKKAGETLQLRRKTRENEITVI